MLHVSFCPYQYPTLATLRLLEREQELSRIAYYKRDPSLELMVDMFEFIERLEGGGSNDRC